MTINIVAADSHPIVLMALENLLSSEPDLHLSALCTNGAQCLDAVREHTPDILIIDIAMSEMDGFEVLRRLADQNPSIRVVLFTASVDEHQLKQAMRLGVAGIVLKCMAPSFLVQCLRKVVAGGQWFEKVSSGRALASMLKREDGLRQVSGILTSREIELTRLVSDGLGNRDIADRLHISEGTVKVHLHRIYRKLGLKNRIALGCFAREIGLV